MVLSWLELKTLLIMSDIKFKDLDIVHICNKMLKHSYISIGEDFKITLKTPTSSLVYAQDLLVKKEVWIRKQLQKIKETKIVKIDIKDEVLLFANIYSIDAKEFSELREQLHRLKNPNLSSITKCYDKFYKDLALIYLTDRLEYFSNIMNLEYAQVKYKKMKSRWGSCNSLGSITLNTQLLKLKKEHIDYVIVHELAHLRFMNHSKNFHDLVRVYLPNERELRTQIRNRQKFTF